MLLSGDYQDIPRIYTALAEWSAAFLFCLIMPRRLKRLTFGIVSTISMAVLVFWLLFTANVDIRLWLPCMAVAVLIMFLYLKGSLKANTVTVLYTTFKALLIAEFAASLEWQVEFFYQQAQMPGILSWIILLLTYGLTLVVIYRLERSMNGSGAEMVVSVKELIMIALIVLLSFTVSNLNFVSQNSPFSSHIVADVFITRTLVDLVGLAILYAYQMRIHELNTERELNAMNAMLKSQYEHYRNYQQNIDLINYKYHDLKHQIAGMKAETSAEKRMQWLDHLEEELDTYKPETQTGNQVLDGILDTKKTMIRNNQIKFTCVADGEQLNFMHVTDICTIFGNVLDNALESMVMIDNPEKRMLHMSVAAKKQFLCIHIENYCEHEVDFVDGRPKTTKNDEAFHGFGTKSVKYTVEKYGGTVSYSLKDHFFRTNILIPIPQN